MNNEQLTIKSSCRKMPLSLYTNAADAAPLYKNVACNDTLGAKRYSFRKCLAMS